MSLSRWEERLTAWDRRPALIAAVLLGAVSLLPMALRYGELFPDSSYYLDAGRHLFRGDGFRTQINLVNLWPGREPFPVFAYYNPLTMLAYGAVWALTPSVKAEIVVFGVLAAILNAWLLFLIAERLFDRPTAWLTMALYLLMPITRQNMEVLATEQTGLACLLLATWLLITRPAQTAALIAAGVVTAAGFLFQVSNLLDTFFLLLAFGVWRLATARRIREVLVVGVTLAVLLGAHQLLCWRVTGTLYPVYPPQAKAWSQSVSLPGVSYHDSLPVLRMPELDASEKLILLRELWPGRLLGYADRLFSDLLWLSIAAALAVAYGLWRWRRWSRHGSPLLVVTAVGHMLTLSLMYYWLDHIEFARYAIVPEALLLGPTIYAVRQAFAHLKARDLWAGLVRSAGLTLGVVLLAHLGLAGAARFGAKASLARHVADAHQAAERLRTLSPRGELIAVQPATHLIAFAFEIDRATTPLPFFRPLNAPAFAEFWRVYHPEWVAFVNARYTTNLQLVTNYIDYLPSVGCAPRDDLTNNDYEVWQCRGSATP
jgi:hypothetical protein